VSSLEQKAEFGKLSEGILHDIMNPLTTISLHLEKISSGHGNFKDMKKSLDSIVVNSHRMQDFMQHIKKSINQTDVQEVESTTLLSSLEVMRDLYGYKIRNENIDFIVDCASRIELPLHHTRLNQLCMNLISNALEAFDEDELGKPNRKKLVEITVQDTEFAQERFIQISIRDNGKGMDDAQKKRAFLTTFTTKQSGSGIGLMTAHQIVTKELGGTIALESEIGRGTTICICIPNRK
jgi:two-component system NtrC family sensor kinase